MSDVNETEPKKAIFGSTPYDVAKDVVTLYIPAFAFFYTGLAQVWHLPYAVEVATTLGLVAGLLGVFLKISSVQYAKLPTNNAGAIVVNTSDPNVPDVAASVKIPLETLKGADTVTLKVVDASGVYGVTKPNFGADEAH